MVFGGLVGGGLVGEDQPVDSGTSFTVGGVEAALNEAEVPGLRAGPASGSIEVLVHVVALPAVGAIEPDARRVLRLRGVGSLQVILRADTPGAFRDQAAVPLADLDEVERFFDSLSCSGSMYGWTFFDAPELTDDRPPRPSLRLDLSDQPGRHSFYWFNECGRPESGQARAYVIEGTITFDTLTVHRADGTEQSLDTFTAVSMPVTVVPCRSAVARSTCAKRPLGVPCPENRPPGATSAKLASPRSPPTLSSTTSAPAAGSAARARASQSGCSESMTASGPSPRTRSSLAPRATATTRAACARPNSTPSPPLAPTTTTASPGLTFVTSNSVSAVGPSCSSAAATGRPSPSGTLDTASAATTARSA